MDLVSRGPALRFALAGLALPGRALREHSLASTSLAICLEHVCAWVPLHAVHA